MISQISETKKAQLKRNKYAFLHPSIEKRENCCMHFQRVLYGRSWQESSNECIFRNYEFQLFQIWEVQRVHVCSVVACQNDRNTSASYFRICELRVHSRFLMVRCIWVAGWRSPTGCTRGIVHLLSTAAFLLRKLLWMMGSSRTNYIFIKWNVTDERLLTALDSNCKFDKLLNWNESEL
jgi:hypothetical protein